MKYFLLIFFVFSLTTGCNFLSSDKEKLSEEESLEEESLEEESLDDIVVEEDMEEDEDELEEDIEEDEEELEEDMEEDEEEFEEDMEEDEDELEEEDIEEDEEELEQDKPKKRGFFSRLFGGSDDEFEEELDSDFIGEDEDFSAEERDYEDYELATEENEEELTENLTSIETTEVSSESIESSKEELTEPEKVKKEKQQNVSLNKIMTVPYGKAGQIVNAVYIVRPNEDINLISEKIYGRNETDQLLEINTHLQNRSLVVGDKVYYNSPNRPNDNKRLLFYYEDNNLSPSYYNLSPGDNIRAVASQILGHPKSWKEIWATNPNLKSKSTVETNLNIVYWPQNIVSKVATAPESALPTPQNNQAEAVKETTEELPPAPEQIMPEENKEEEIPQIEENLNQAIPNIPTEEVKTKKSKGIIEEILNNIELIVGFIVFLILLYLIIHIILKKRKQRDFDYTATNIEVE